jgi:hypothetical protein
MANTQEFGLVPINMTIAGTVSASDVTNDSSVTGATVKDALNNVASYFKLLQIQSPSIDASTNPNYPAALQYQCWFISVAGKIGGASGDDVEVGDLIVCLTANAGGTKAAVGAYWTTIQVNLAGALLAANNLSELTATASTARSNIAAVGNLTEIEIPIDGGEYTLELGIKTPFKAIKNSVTTITGWRMRLTDGDGADVTDSLTVDVLASTTYNGALSSIVGAGTKPAIASAASATGTITNWETTTLTKGGWITLQITSAPVGLTAASLSFALDVTVS